MLRKTPQPAPLVDRFGRQITYLRLSVTDRCDLRCTYCMPRNMQFLPKKDLLSLEELERVAAAFISRGVRKIRLTGGEPLVRRGMADFIGRLGQYLGAGLDELTLTTNATQLKTFAPILKQAGVKRVNVSLDSLDPKTFAEITRFNRLDSVLDGIEAARSAGLHVKINTVALKQQNRNDIPDIMEWAHARGLDMSLIEVMPLGETGEDRFDQYVPLTMIRSDLEARYHLQPETRADPLGGPSTYVRVNETGGRLGFITPLSHNFCASCNRVRVTCTGRIYMCLGQEDHIDLRSALREYPESDQTLHAALDAALGAKPEKHDFVIRQAGERPELNRHMSTTGG